MTNLDDLFDANIAFRRWFRAGFGSELMPIIPPDATLSPKSSARPENRGKTPGVRNDNGMWVGLVGKWADKLKTTVRHAKRWAGWGASVGLQCRIFNVADLDIEDEAMAQAIESIAIRIFGRALVRYRDGSPRRLLLYKAKGKLRKRRIAWRDDTGTIHAIDWLAYGQQFVCEGPHPKGGSYRWRDPHPCDVGIDGVTEITEEQVNRFFVEVVQYIEMMGYELTASTGGGVGSSSNAKPLGDTSLHAPSPQLVLDVLAAVPCNEETFTSRDEFVLVLRAIKAALGAARQEHWPAVLDWSLQYPGSEPDYIEKIWDSFDDSKVGWDFFAAWASRYGYTGGAQGDFATEDPNARIPETPSEKMIKRYVWIEALGRFYDEQTGHLIAGREFNAANVAVATFGRSGDKTAEAEFLNASNARKVDTVTSRPGEPVITTETNEYGVTVSAVNLWRPSNVKPDASATDRDVEPWLDLVTKLFGKGTPEYEHFLDYWAYLLQNPGRKIGHALVIIGGQGVGKDSVLAPLFEAVGDHNVAPIDTATLANQWTHYLKAQIIYVQEIHQQGRRDQYNHLKPFISSQRTRLQVNEKGLRQYFVPNHQNWIIASNHGDAIALDDDDRRFWVHRVLIDEPPGDDYFTKYRAWLAAGGFEKVYGWLLRRDVGGFNPMARPPMTTAKRAMLEETQPAPVRLLRGLLVDDGPFANRDLMIANDLSRALDDWTLPQGVVAKHAVAALKAAGFKPGHRVRLGRDVRQLWARNLPARLSPDKMRDLYLAEVAEEGKGKEAA
jgi:Family of unknown function (DUF5906)